MTALEQTLDRLTDKSQRGFYNPYEEFDWPSTMDRDSYWMSPELLTVHGTELEKSLDEATLKKLSQCELVHFFSVNIHGEKELVTSVVDAIYTTNYMNASRYFHHFLVEETVHMWFFSEFCTRYAEGLYPNLATPFSVAEIPEREVKDLITFSRIYIIERIIVYFNGFMQEDERLAPILRKINRIHFAEESRHLAMGEAIVKELSEAIKEKYGEDRLAEVGKYLVDYTKYCVNSLYNPAVYRDAGLDKPYEVRRQLLADPARLEINAKLENQAMRHFTRLGVVNE